MKYALLAAGLWGLRVVHAFSCFGHPYRAVDTHPQFGEAFDQKNLGLCSSFARAHALSAAASRASADKRRVSPYAIAASSYLSDPLRRRKICSYSTANGFDPFGGGDAIGDTDRQFLQKQCLVAADSEDHEEVFNELNSFFSAALPKEALEALRSKDFPARISEGERRLNDAKDPAERLKWERELASQRRKLLVLGMVMELRSSHCPREAEVSQALINEFQKNAAPIDLGSLEVFDPTAEIGRACAKGDRAAALKILGDSLCLGLPILTAIGTERPLSYRRMAPETYRALAEGSAKLEKEPRTDRLTGMQHATVLSGLLESEEGVKLVAWDSNVGSAYGAEKKNLFLFDEAAVCQLGPYRIFATPEEMRILKSNEKSKEAWHLQQISKASLMESFSLSTRGAAEPEKSPH